MQRPNHAARSGQFEKSSPTMRLQDRTHATFKSATVKRPPIRYCVPFSWPLSTPNAGCSSSRQAAALAGSFSHVRAALVLVANETGLGIVPDNALARRFRDASGLMNQQIAAAADNVLFVAAGLPLVMKGRNPVLEKV